MLSSQCTCSHFDRCASVTGLLGIAIAAILVFQYETLHSSAGVCLLDKVSPPKDSFKFFDIAKRDAKTALHALDVLEQHCKSLTTEFEDLSKNFTDGGELDLLLRTFVSASFQGLLDFERQYSYTMSFVDGVLASWQQHDVSNLSSQVSEEEMPATERAEQEFAMCERSRSVNRVCFLRLVTVARRLAQSLPHEAGNANGALGCKPGILSDIEARAVHDAEAVDDETAAASMHLGAYWSELAVAGRFAAPLFGSGAVPLHVATSRGVESGWMRDSWGTHAPADMVHAENVFARSQPKPFYVGRRALASNFLHAQRLEEHAKFLESQGYHNAAAHRYRTMASISGEAGNAPLSAHALSQLSYSLKQHGAHEEAIEVAKDAVALTMDPLARWVLASARLSSGLLNTDAAIKAAELQVQAVAGHLPTQDLELQRAKMHYEMRMWRWISERDISQCWVTRDAARFLICFICKLIF
jgi:tetratricopeptide (TPR) repeat protein